MVEEVEEEDSETEYPGEDRSDCDVVAHGAIAEGSEEERDCDGCGEESEAEVDAGRGGGDCAGEGDVAECLSCEDLAAENDEVADRAAGEGDGRACDEGEPNEFLRGHQAATVAVSMLMPRGSLCQNRRRSRAAR